MNRYAFYFVVSLLAFAVGIGFVYIYFYKLNRIETLNEFTQVESTESSHLDLAALEKLSAEIRPISGLEIILLFYKPTIDKWQKGEKIPLLVKPSPEIIEQIKELSNRYKIAKELTVNEIYRPKAVDLNNDGKKELIIFQKLFDEPLTNQSSWNLLIFERFGKEIGLIFYEGGMQNYRILKTKTNGFLDVALINNDIESQNTFVEVFKSNGKIYNILTCYEEIRRYQDRKGVWRKLKKPRIEHPGDCC